LLAYRVLENESACFDEISISFLGSRAVQRLNRQFTGRDDATDTLAFDMTPEKMKRGPVAGVRVADVIVCVDKAIEQSQRFRVGLEKELARLTVHGLLHLCGFEDRTRTQKLRMRRREDLHLRLLSGLVSHLVRRPREARVASKSGRRSGRNSRTHKGRT